MSVALIDDARLAPHGTGAAGEPDRARRVRNLGEAVCGIDRGKPAGHHRGSGEAAHACASQARSEHVFDASRRHHMPVLQHHDARGEPRHLIDGMGHIDDRNMQFVAKRLDERQDLELALGVERGERLVHQQDLGRSEQRPADGHPLPFAAREPRRLALEQMLDAERLDHPAEGNLPRGLRREPAAEQEISPDAEMREELGVLENEPDPAAIGRHEDRGLRVHQHAAVEHDGAAIRPRQPSDQIDGHRLARAGPAEQGGDARVILEGDVEIEGAEFQRNVNADHAEPAIPVLIKT